MQIYDSNYVDDINFIENNIFFVSFWRNYIYFSFVNKRIC